MAFHGTVEQLARLEKLKNERSNIHNQQVALNDGILAESRDYTDTEQRKWDGLDARFHEIDAEIKELERFEDGLSVSDMGNEVFYGKWLWYGC